MLLTSTRGRCVGETENGREVEKQRDVYEKQRDGEAVGDREAHREMQGNAQILPSVRCRPCTLLLGLWVEWAGGCGNG